MSRISVVVAVVVARAVCTCALVTDRDLECVMTPFDETPEPVACQNKHERGNKTSGTPCSTLTATTHGTTRVDQSR